MLVQHTRQVVMKIPVHKLLRMAILYQAKILVQPNPLVHAPLGLPRSLANYTQMTGESLRTMANFNWSTCNSNYKGLMSCFTTPVRQQNDKQFSIAREQSRITNITYHAYHSHSSHCVFFINHKPLKKFNIKHFNILAIVKLLNERNRLYIEYKHKSISIQQCYCKYINNNKRIKQSASNHQ